MRSPVLIAGALLAFTAPAATAGGVNLSWDDCGTAGVGLKTFACDSSDGVPFPLVASFEPTVTMTDMVANEWVIDVVAKDAALPAWWAFTGTNCRGGAMTLTTYYPGGPFSCADPWNGQVNVQGFGYTIGYQGPNTARILGVQALPASDPVRVDAGTEYYSFTLVINRSRTTGADACADCLGQVCLFLARIEVIGLTGSVQETAPRDRSWVYWQGSYFPFWGCQVPVLRQSWGRMKSLYR